MFEVYGRAPDGAKWTVYDVRCDNTGFPHFLIYNPLKNEWVYRSAKEFIPIEWEHLRK